MKYDSRNECATWKLRRLFFALCNKLKRKTTYISACGQTYTDVIWNGIIESDIAIYSYRKGLFEYLSDIEDQAENMFQRFVKSLAKQENATEKMKTAAPM